MSLKIFFSWQADTPTREGRNLIERALRKAIDALKADIELEQPERRGLPEIEIDKDTYGVPGSPPIVDTIFQKIDEATIFVPDLTFVGKRLDRQRPTPNPNVLIEYGWALKKLGYGRIVPVMNTAFGKPEGDAMPFNMRHLRHPIPYNCPKTVDEPAIAAAKRDLAKDLETAIRAVLNSAEFQASLPRPPEPKLFVPRSPAHGKGRFRPAGTRLGVDARDNADILLTNGKALWLRLIPQIDPGRTWSLSEVRAAMEHPSLVLPLLAGPGGGFGTVRDEDGFGVYAGTGNPHETSWANYLFETGEIWGVDTWRVPRTAHTKTISIPEDVLIETLAQFEECLGRLGLTRPFKWIAGIEGIEGRRLWVPYNHEPVGKCVSDEIVAEGKLEGEIGAAEALEQFFVKIYERAGQLARRKEIYEAPHPETKQGAHNQYSASGQNGHDQNRFARHVLIRDAQMAHAVGAFTGEAGADFVRRDCLRCEAFLAPIDYRVASSPAGSVANSNAPDEKSIAAPNLPCLIPAAQAIRAESWRRGRRIIRHGWRWWRRRPGGKSAPAQDAEGCSGSEPGAKNIVIACLSGSRDTGNDAPSQCKGEPRPCR